jgi:N utilization substance protein B
VIGSRREARETALGLLYEADVRGEDPADTLARQVVAPVPYARDLVEGVAAHRDEIDARLRGASHGWTLERMAVVDRAVLRVATFELAHRPDVPTGVVVDEAVELAKQYSTEDSGRFVNGVLGALARALRPDPSDPPEGSAPSDPSDRSR